MFCDQSCGNDKWGNWRPHLAVMLSNDTGDHAVQQRAIVTMGDTLGMDAVTCRYIVSARTCKVIVSCLSSGAASRGLLHAAHVCYLTASVPFGAFTQKEARMVLLGSSHRWALIHCEIKVRISKKPTKEEEKSRCLLLLVSHLHLCSSYSSSPVWWTVI